MANRVLVVAEVVADVGEQLHQRDPDVSHVPFGPGRHRLRQPVQDELAQPFVVTGQVGRLQDGGARGGGCLGAGDRVGQVDVEGEPGLGEAGVKAPQRGPAGAAVGHPLDQPQHVAARAAGGRELDQQPVLELRIGLRRPYDRGGADRRRTVRPVDADVGRVYVRRRVLEEGQDQPLAATVDLDRIEPVAVTAADLLAARTARHHQVTPPRCPAAHVQAHPTGTWRVRVDGAPVARTR